MKILILIFLILNCASSQLEENSGLNYFYPVDEQQLTLDENGKEVLISSEDDVFFQKKSEEPFEYFRIVLSSDAYHLRQIRGNEIIDRKVDISGDQLISENIQKYNRINFFDYGVIKIDFNQEARNIKSVRFSQAPRINEIAKIIQNDITRWKLDFFNLDDEFPLSYIFVKYKVILKQNKSQ